jgi:Bacterial SH3 domain
MLGRAPGLQVVRAAVALGIAMVLASCAASRESVGGWFGAAPTPVSAAAGAPRVYYAAVDGLKVYTEPSTSSKVVGTLSLHERVTRSDLRRGYALVESSRSGVKGWVDNARLLWRVPTAPATSAPAPAEAPPEEPVPPTREEPQAPAAPEATTATVEPSPETTPVPAETPPASTVGPSIFNPY